MFLLDGGPLGAEHRARTRDSVTLATSGGPENLTLATSGGPDIVNLITNVSPEILTLATRGGRRL